MPLAPILIEEGQPDGFGQPAVFCASNGSVAYTHYQAPANTMVYDFTAVPGANALCHWFMIPDQGNVAVFKWICPHGIDASSEDVGYFHDTCDEVGDGIIFHLQKDGLDSPQVFIKGAGWVSWDGIGGGTATIWEEIPIGFVQPVVFCTGKSSPLAPANPYDLMPVDSGRIELEFGETYLHYSCHWYNIPGDPENSDGWLDLTTYACPEGTIDDAATADAAAFTAACPASQNGIPVTLDLGDGHAPFGATTGDAGPGRVFFPLPDGTYSEIALREDLPADVVDHALFCRKDGPASESEREDEWLAGAYWLDLEPGRTWLCDWYNIVAPDGGDGEDGPGGGTDDGGDGSDGSGDGTDGADSGTSIETEQLVVVTLPDTGVGPVPGTSSMPMAWVLSLVALGGALGMAFGVRRSPIGVRAG